MNARSFKLFVGAVLVQAFVAGSAQAAVNLGGSLGDQAPTVSGPDPMFTYSFNIGLDSGIGTLNAIDEGGGEFLATGGTLSVLAGPALGNYSLVPGGPGGFNDPFGLWVADNLFYPGSDPTLDNSGLLFTDGLNDYVNIWGPDASNGGGPGIYGFGTSNGGNYTLLDYPVRGDFTLTAVPEPAIWAMLLLGFFGVGTMMRRSRGLQMLAAA